MNEDVRHALATGLLPLQEGIGQSIYDNTIGKAKTAVNDKIVQPIKDKAGQIVNGVKDVALTAGAAYLGAKNGEAKGKAEAEKQASEFGPAAEITDSVIGLDKQKYQQLAQIYKEDPELVKNHKEEGEIIGQVNTVLQRFKQGE